MATRGHRIIAGGNTVIAAAGTPEPLTAATQPCSMVWVGAPHNDAGVAQNTSVARVGLAGAGNQRIALAVADIAGIFIPCSDTTDVYVNVGTNGDSLDYQVFA